MKTVFFTYRIKWTKLDMSYYGVRYKEGENQSSLMSTYFTSSRYVKEFIKTHGLPDVIEVRKTFDTKTEAKRWEEKVISRGRLYLSERWLNKGNNNAFKGVVMDDDIKRRISEAQREKLSKVGKKAYYNNGETSILIPVNKEPPPGYVIGKIPTEGQKRHRTTLNDKLRQRSDEEKELHYKKISKSTKGKPKPEGFGEKVSASTKGKPKPWNMGEANPSKTKEAREKISKSWETREIGCWLYDPSTMDCIYVKPSENRMGGLLSNGYKRGRPPKGEWFNNGEENIWVRYDEFHKADGLTKGKIYQKKMWVTNGSENRQVPETDFIEQGWRRGRTNFTK